MTGLAGFVLAAGLGTRIATLSRRVPKPLLPVGLETPLFRAVSALRRAGAEPIVANAAHLPEQVVAAGRALGIEVVVEEGGPFGTGGGLCNARDRFGTRDVAIWNGDIVAELDVAALASARRGTAILAVRGDAPIGKGNVGLDRDGRVVRLRDRLFGEEARGAFYAAISVLSHEVVARAPERGCMVGDLLIPMLSQGARVDSFVYEGPWHDVGDLASYLAANLGHGTMLGRDVTIAPGVSLENAVVGAGARVEGRGVLRDVVVFPSAVACVPLSRAIVTDDEIVPVP
ncbi:MAG: sugar phosphate nucleotidyltransferase [Polyangiales bacterium]